MRSGAQVLLLGLLVGSAAFGTYAGSLHNEFVWDDRVFLRQQLPYFRTLHDLLVPSKDMPQYAGQYYRPLTLASLLLDESLATASRSPADRESARRFVYHLSGILLHVLISVLVYLIGIHLWMGKKRSGNAALGGAFAAGLLFAVHPIHVESVAWMSGRSDVLCGLFYLGSILCHVRYRLTMNLHWLILSLVSALTAMLSKETGLGLVLVLPLVDWSLTAGGRQSTAEDRATGHPPRLLRFLPLLPALGYGLLRLIALHGSGVGSTPLEGAKLHSLLGAIGWYLVKLIWPAPQSAFVTGVPPGPYWLAGLFGLGATAYLVVRAVRKNALGPGLIASAILLIGLAPSLATAILQISDTPLAERYLYIPSAGFCIWIGILLERTANTPRISMSRAARAWTPVILAVLLAIPVAAASVQRSRIWKSDLAFWQSTVKDAPEEGIPRLQLGAAYAELHRYEEALSEYRLALRYYRSAEGRSRVYNNIASTLVDQKRFPEAIEECRSALQEDPHYASAHYNWALAALSLARGAQTQEERGRLGDEGIEQLRKTLAENPRFTRAQFRLGVELVQQGRVEEGMNQLNQVLTIAPGSEEAANAKSVMDQVRKQMLGN